MGLAARVQAGPDQQTALRRRPYCGARQMTSPFPSARASPASTSMARMLPFPSTATNLFARMVLGTASVAWPKATVIVLRSCPSFFQPSFNCHGFVSFLFLFSCCQLFTWKTRSQRLITFFV
jgi:hypothetical protein